MAARTLEHRTALLGIFPHVRYTLGKLKWYPEGAPYVSIFEAIRTEGQQVMMMELGIIDAQVEAQVRVDLADARLNDFAGLVSRTVIGLGGAGTEGPVYKHFFGNKNLSEFRKPTLGDQLESMRGWLESLKNSPYAELSALLPRLEPLIDEADEAKKARDAAKKQNRLFRDMGERRAWLDGLNAARKELYGAMAKLPHQHPHLPSNFADLFFMKESKREGEVAEYEEETAEGLRAQVAELRAALEQLEARLVEVEAAEEAEKKAAEARAAEEALLTELDREMAELEARRVALRARLGESAGR